MDIMPKLAVCTEMLREEGGDPVRLPVSELDSLPQ